MQALPVATSMILEIVCALLLWWATIMTVAAVCGNVDAAAALKVVNIALAALLVLLFFFMLGGTWFVYYIRQETLVVSHEATIGLTIAAAMQRGRSLRPFELRANGRLAPEGGPA